ncbi:MAG TPA: CotH kinase family protein [Solirubrobacterales bacterium]|nr:CotH kinase family protein [Solirubrobacterales bacterium]
MYRPGVVNVIKLELPEASYEALQESPEGDYQPGTFSMAVTDGTPDGIGAFSPPLEAQIRLKGSGSFRPLGQKAAFKVKFAKKTPFHGLRKMTLNNMVQDVSMVHEALSYRLFHVLGVPASRTSYAEVWVNGVNYGLHTNIESLDKVALEKRFGTFEDPPQHLYEGEYNADITAGRISLLEVDEGDEKDRSDLNALAAASNNPGGDWSDAVAPHANLVEMTRMWMGEKYIGHVDGYAGEANTNRPNNFYLYSDPAGQFRMLPWGTDQTWVFNAPFGTAGGSLFTKCIADASCLALYKAAGHRALQIVPELDLNGMASCLATRLAPWQKREPAAMAPNSPGAISSAVTATKGFLNAERSRLATYLGVPAPPPPTTPGACPAYGTEPDESLVEPPPDVEEEPEEEEPPEEEPPEEEPPVEEPPVKEPPVEEPPEEEPEEPEEEEPGEEEGLEEEGGEKEPGTGGQQTGGTQDLVPPPLAIVPLDVGTLRVGRLSLHDGTLRVKVGAPVPGRLSLTVRINRLGAVCTRSLRVSAGEQLVRCRLDAAARGKIGPAEPRRLTVVAQLLGSGGEELETWVTPRLGRR